MNVLTECDPLQSHVAPVSVFITTYHVLPEYTSLIVRTRASRAVQELLDLQREGPARCGGTGAAHILYRSNRFIDNCGSYGDRAQNDRTGRR